MFSPINWSGLSAVAAASVLGSLAVVLMFSLGIRFLVNADHARAKATNGDAAALRGEAWNRALSYVFFALSFAAVIYGVLLIIPNVIPAIK